MIYVVKIFHLSSIGSVYFYWITVVAIAFVYNALGIFLRSAFDCHDRQRNLLPLWLTLDYVCDIIYLVDIVAVQFHLSYSDRGLLVVRGPITHASPHSLHTIRIHTNTHHMHSNIYIHYYRHTLQTHMVHTYTYIFVYYAINVIYITI